MQDNRLFKNLTKETVKVILNSITILIFTLLYVLMITRYYINTYYFDFGIRGYIVLATLYIVVTIIFFYMYRATKIGTTRIAELSITRIISMFFVDFTMYFILGLIRGALAEVLPHIALFIIQAILCVPISYYNNVIYRYNFKPLKTLVIYDGSSSSKLTAKKLSLYQPMEFDIKAKKNYKDVDNKDLEKLLNKYESIITIEVPHSFKKKAVKLCYKNNINVYDVPSITDVLIKTSDVTNFIDTPLFKLNKLGPNQVEIKIKRIFDVIVASILVIFTSPIMLITALIIKLQDKGDIFFKQKRLTLNGKEFEVIKFRSMIMNAEPDGKAIRAKENDLRITKFGKFIRSTRIDELPQLFNILKGDMSFIGPRALRIEEYEQNRKIFPEFEYRLKVKAGLSGYGQVYGKYNTSFRDKLLLDIYYIENYSLLLDTILFFMTIATMLKKDATEGFNE